jgi:hypothetical protein
VRVALISDLHGNALALDAVWHARNDADQAHRWLRTAIAEVARSAPPARAA